MGSKPETFKDWFWKPLNSLSAVLIGVIITIGMAIVTLVMLIVVFVVEIFLEILPILGYILWLIICALILIFIWIIFVLTLVMVIISFFIISGIISLLCAAIGLDFSLNFNTINIQNEEITADIGYKILMDTNEFFKLEYPTISFYTSKGNTTFEIKFGFFTDSLEFPKPNVSEDFYDGLYGEQQSSSNLKLSSGDNPPQLTQFYGSMGSIMGLAGSLMAIIGAIMIASANLSPIFLALSLHLFGVISNFYNWIN